MKRKRILRSHLAQVCGSRDYRSGAWHLVHYLRGNSFEVEVLQPLS